MRCAPLLLLAALSALSITACASAPPRAASAPPKAWTDPDGRFTVDLSGTPRPRDVQELTFIGTVSFKVYAVDTDFSYRVSAFAYPWAQGQPFDRAGELAHASGRAIARMGGKPDREQPVVVDGVDGKDIYFSFTTHDGIPGRGLQRMLISEAPPMRYHAFCIGPVDADLAPCEAFIRSFHPHVARPVSL